MTPDILLALVLFVLVASITPGPNNMMLLSSGVTFGFARTIPHILGISAGCVVMVLALGWSMAGIVRHMPVLYSALHILSAIYLCWLAWRIATSVGPGDVAKSGRPLRFIDAAGFQWVNPKAWAMVLGAVSSFARPGHLALDVPLIALVLFLVGLPSICLWAGSGLVLKRVLRNPATLRAFNIGMALLLVGSILPGLWQEFGHFA
jgi:threonine/homoserine/homoserine lactone efflux protein